LFTHHLQLISSRFDEILHTSHTLLSPPKRLCFDLCLSVCLLTGLLKATDHISEMLRNGWS